MFPYQYNQPMFCSCLAVNLCMQDLTKDVFRIDAIPSQSLDTVREWLSSMDIKFYENKVNLNWKQVLKSIVDVRLSVLY